MTEAVKTVLVTGAAKRLGRAIALDLARHGWSVAIHYNSSEKEARATAADAATSGVKVALLKADLSRESETATLIERAAAELGPLTGLVNSASLFENDDWYSVSRESWDKHMETNLRAPFVLAQAFARQVPRDGHGAIVNLIDQRVLKPTPQFLSYSLSKAGPEMADDDAGPGAGAARPGQRRRAGPHHHQCAPVPGRFLPPARRHRAGARRRASGRLRRGALSVGSLRRHRPDAGGGRRTTSDLADAGRRRKGMT